MKRLVSLLIVLAAVVLAQSPVQLAEAAPPGCFCGPYYYTPQLWGQGASCAEAESNLRAQAISYVYCENGRCALEFVVTAGCHRNTYDNAWQVDGYYRWRCWECE